MSQPYRGKDPNFTQEWWDLVCSAPEKIEHARAKTKAIREGRAPVVHYDYGDVLTKAGLDAAAEVLARDKKTRVSQADRLLPASLRDE